MVIQRLLFTMVRLSGCRWVTDPGTRDLGHLSRVPRPSCACDGVRARVLSRARTEYERLPSGVADAHSLNPSPEPTMKEYLASTYGDRIAEHYDAHHPEVDLAAIDLLAELAG